jgi:hypothetical protein
MQANTIKIVNNFEIHLDKEQGKGSYGFVYQCNHIEAKDKKLAVKILNKKKSKILSYLKSNKNNT